MKKTIDKIQDLKETRLIVLSQIRYYERIQKKDEFEREKELLNSKQTKLEQQLGEIGLQQIKLQRDYDNATTILNNLKIQLADLDKRIKEPKDKVRRIERLKKRIANLKSKLQDMEN